MKISGLMAGAALAASTLLGANAAAAGTLFTDLAPGYNCCQGWTVGGPTSPVGEVWSASEFSAAASGAISQIDLGLSALIDDGAVVSLWTDGGGSLGSELGSWTVSGLPNFGGSGSALVTISGITGISLTAGDSYYLRIDSATSGGWDAWNFNTVGLNTDFIQSGIDFGSNTTGAFDILSSVPEPASWAMMLVGFAFLGTAVRRRRAATLPA